MDACCARLYTSALGTIRAAGRRGVPLHRVSQHVGTDVSQMKFLLPSVVCVSQSLEPGSNVIVVFITSYPLIVRTRRNEVDDYAVHSSTAYKATLPKTTTVPSTKGVETGVPIIHTLIRKLRSFRRVSIMHTESAEETDVSMLTPRTQRNCASAFSTNNKGLVSIFDP